VRPIAPVDLASGPDLWVLRVGDRTTYPLVRMPSAQREGSFSSRGDWLAFNSNETGSNEVYIQPFPTAAAKYQVSTDAGSARSPRWRADGRELFFDSSGRMMSVALNLMGSTVTTHTPRVLFRALSNLPPHNYDLTPAGGRFLVLTVLDPGGDFARAVVETNWSPPDAP
jgi:hypothetical protein